MSVIYKVQLALQESQSVWLPQGATFLHAGYQHDSLCAWALIDDPHAPNRDYRVAVIGTGNSIAAVHLEGLRHLSTCIGQMFVWHVFVEVPNE